MNTSAVEYSPFTINVPKMDVKRFKSIAKAMEWIVVPVAIKEKTKCPSAMEEAMEDVRLGRVYHADSVDDMFNQILG